MRALVLSGGGSRGAFQVGAIKALREENREWYKVYCGVSVGAINCAHLAQYYNTDVQSQLAVDNLYKFWSNLEDKKVKKHWFPFSFLHSLWKGGLYNLEPLRQLLYKDLVPTKIIESGNKLRVGAVNLNTRQYEIFDENDLIKYGISVLLASASTPMALEPIEIGGYLYSDGGIRTVTPLASAVNIPEVTEIDIVLANPMNRPVTYKSVNTNIINVGLSIINSMNEEIPLNDIKLFNAYNRLAQLGESDRRYVRARIFQPEGNLPGSGANYDNASVIKMINIGYETTKRQLENKS